MYEIYSNISMYIYPQLIQIDCQDSAVSEVKVWRRFNDFKKLYKSMSKLHSALHRKETFPPFVKSKVFGR